MISVVTRGHDVMTPTIHRDIPVHSNRQAQTFRQAVDERGKNYEK